MTRKIFVAILFATVIFSCMSNTSYQADSNTSNITNGDGVNFWEELILVLIPIGAGVGTTKWLTNSWQKRDEENKVKKEILDDFGNSYERALGLTDVFFLMLMEKYTNYQEVNGIRDPNFKVYLKFPLDKRSKPVKELFESFAKFQNDIYQTNLTQAQFTSSLTLYYDDKITERELGDVADKIDSLYFIVRRLVLDSSTREDFDNTAFEYDSTYEDVRIIVRDFKQKLVDTTIMD